MDVSYWKFYVRFVGSFWFLPPSTWCSTATSTYRTWQCKGVALTSVNDDDSSTRLRVPAASEIPSSRVKA